MRLKAKLKTYFFIGTICLITSVTTFADTVATKCSYAVPLEEARLVFVMIVAEPNNECLSQGPEKLEAAKSLRKRYKTSGLYPASGSEPLWTVDWFSYQVFLSADGRSLVRTGPWASKDSDEALSFFSEGKLLRTYAVKDIIRYVSALPHSVSHFEWQKHLEINNSKRTFEVTTLEEGRLSFNLENGEIIAQSLPLLPTSSGLSEPRLYVTNLAVLIAILIAGVVTFFFVLWWRKRRMRGS